MALTLAEQIAALVVLDAAIPAQQTVGQNSRYTQVIGYSPDGVHTVGLDEYLGPAGVGYVRWVNRADATGTRWQYDDPQGPEARPSGWRELKAGPSP